MSFTSTTVTTQVTTLWFARLDHSPPRLRTRQLKNTCTFVLYQTLQEYIKGSQQPSTQNVSSSYLLNCMRYAFDVAQRV